MKLAEIKVGEEYGAVDHPTADRGELPRQVKVREIVQVEEKVWNQFAGTFKTMKKKRVCVEFLTEPTGNRRWGGHIESAEKGAIKNVEARHLVALWNDLLPGLRKRAEDELERKAAAAAMEARWEKLLGEDAPGVTTRRYDGGMQHDVHLSSPELERVLAWAETGKSLLKSVETDA